MMKRICTFITFLVLISYNNCDASVSIQHPERRRLSIPRGGGEDKVHDNTNIEKKHQQTSDISLPLSSLPLIDSLSVSLALRLTAETNRRLQHTTSKEQPKEEQTVFHSTVSYQESPELKTYLDALLSAVGLDDSTSTNPMDDERQVILALSLLYIDRSTSVDTPTDDYHQTGQMGGGSHPSPYISPRTVHYMILTSLSIAIKCVRGDKDNDVSNKLREAANSIYEKDIIPEVKMEQMERTLLHSLAGRSGGNVSHEEISTFMRQFATMMYPMRLKAHEQTKLKQLERFMRHQNAAGFGTGQVNNQHGHGNHWQQSDDSHANNRLSIESRNDHQWQAEQQYYPDQQQY